MMNILRIATRNMTRQRRRSVLLGSAIAFGIFVVTLLNGTTGGLVNGVTGNLSRVLGGHIFVSGSEVSPSGRVIDLVHNDSVLMQALAESGIAYERITRRSRFQGTLHFGSKTVIQTIEGVDWNAESFLSRHEGIANIDESAMKQDRAIILPEPVAKSLKVQVGETIVASLTTATGQQNVGEFILAGVIPDPGVLGSLSAYAKIGYVNEVLNLKPGEYQTLTIYLKNLNDVDAATTALSAAIAHHASVFPREKQSPGLAGHAPGGFIDSSTTSVQADEIWSGTRYRVVNLKEMMAQLISIMDVLNSVGLGIFIVLLAITMVGITNTFRMVMLERVREIGTMRAIGMQRGSVRNIFLGEAMMISVTGAAIGILAALAVMGAASTLSFDPQSVISLFLRSGHPEFSLGLPRLATNLLILLVLCFAAAWFPARRAAALDPANALRTIG